MDKRKAARRPLRMEVRLASGQSPVTCWTENVSETGMLVRTPQPFAVGAMVAFEIHVPGGRPPVQGEAEVVRHAAPDAEGTAGMGLRLDMLREDGHQRLAEFLRAS